MKTHGTKNVLNNKETNLTKFWELNKLTKLQKNENKIRTQEEMIRLATVIINNNEIDSSNKFYDFIRKYSIAKVIKNQFGKKLFIKLGE